ncbi:MAG TPA: hypothetical protein VGD79_02540 [Thermoanaerobaculia bacterium]|jgi:hypothetical protein
MRQASVHAALLLFFSAAAVVMTWPLAPNLTLAMAHPGDPLITSWVLDWDFYALTHDPARLFHANIFYPLRYTLAFTENTLGIMLAMLPLFVANVPLLALHNVAILAGFALAGYGAALLGRHVTGSTVAGVVAGIFFAFVPWRFTHLTHLQHLWTVWLPLLVLALLRLAERPTRGRAALFAAVFVMNGLTNLHWLAFGSVAIVCCVAIAAFFVERASRFLAYAAVAIVCGSVMLVPLLIPYWRAGQLYNMRGDAGETLHYSARASDWLVASLHNRFYGPRLNDGTGEPEHWSFPGVAGPLLALVGVVIGLKRSRLAATLGLFLCALGFVGSLGLHTPFGRFLFDFVPLFRGIRVQARWSMIVYLGLAILIALGAHALMRRRWIAVVLSAVLLLELRAAPIRWYLATGETPPVYSWLAKQKLRGGVLELPMDQPSVYRYLYFSHVHHQPLIDGVSGFKPPEYLAMERESLMTPVPPSFFERFRAHGGTLVIVHGESGGVASALQKVGAIDDGTTVYATPEQAALLTPLPVLRRSLSAVLEHPVHWEEVTGPLEVLVRVTGEARTATLYFDNRRVRIEVPVRGPVFRYVIQERPSSIRADTDLQVEIDGKRLPQVWLRWRRPGEILPEYPLPQTSDLGAYRVRR